MLSMLSMLGMLDARYLLDPRCPRFLYFSVFQLQFFFFFFFLFFFFFFFFFFVCAFFLALVAFVRSSCYLLVVVPNINMTTRFDPAVAKAARRSLGTVLVTGGTGFLGSFIVHQLVEIVR